MERTPLNPLTFTGRLRSVKFAVRGIATMLKTQHNAWLHAAATVLVIAGGLVVRLSVSEWCWIALAITSVWSWGRHVWFHKIMPRVEILHDLKPKALDEYLQANFGELVLIILARTQFHTEGLLPVIN